MTIKTNIAFRLAATAFGLLASAGCGLVTVSHGDATVPDFGSPTAQEQQAFHDDGEEDSEAGVEQLNTHLRDFHYALRTDDFRMATIVLRRAKKALYKASEATRSHPEFEDTRDALEAAIGALKQAIEKDRV